VEAENLTDSVYAMIVLTYATLAATAYIFGTIEAKAKDSLSKIDKFKKGECKRVWDQQPTDDDEPALGEKKSAITKVREEYDTVKSGDNAKVERWPSLQVALFASVSISALLLLPVLLLHLGIFSGTIIYPWLSAITRTILVIEQMFASLSVPIVGLNIFKMAKKLKRIEALESNLEMLAGALRLAKNGDNGNGHKPPSPVADITGIR
jgi:hypothetical protein